MPESLSSSIGVYSKKNPLHCCRDQLKLGWSCLFEAKLHAIFKLFSSLSGYVLTGAPTSLLQRATRVEHFVVGTFDGERGCRSLRCEFCLGAGTTEREPASSRLLATALT